LVCFLFWAFFYTLNFYLNFSLL